MHMSIHHAIVDREPPTIVRGDMNSLIRAFPSMVTKPAPAWTNDSNDWRKWIRAGCLSSGELVTAQFILHVWNWRDNQEERPPFRFSFGMAMNVWDDGHLAAFNAWARAPWYA